MLLASYYLFMENKIEREVSCRENDGSVRISTASSITIFSHPTGIGCSSENG